MSCNSCGGCLLCCASPPSRSCVSYFTALEVLAVAADMCLYLSMRGATRVQILIPLLFLQGWHTTLGTPHLAHHTWHTTLGTLAPSHMTGNTPAWSTPPCGPHLHLDHPLPGPPPCLDHTSTWTTPAWTTPPRGPHPCLTQSLCTMKMACLTCGRE